MAREGEPPVGGPGEAAREPPAKRSGRDNLFGVDPAGVVSQLRAANLGLLPRRDALLAALERVPDPLPDGEAVERAVRFAGQLRRALGEARQAKTADCAPLRAAQKAADGFFETVSKPLDRALRRVEGLLTRAATLPAPPPAVPSPAAASAGAESAAVAGALPAPPAVPPAAPPIPPAAAAAAAELPLVWQAGTVSRAALNLEALRSHFTDVELDRAVARWLEANGPAPLAGVQWRRVVRTARARDAGGLDAPAD